MTHTAAFSITDELKALFEEQFSACEPGSRLGAIQVAIADESFALVGKSHLESSAALSELLNSGAATDPCYVLLRTPDGWIQGSFVPDDAPVRSKMLYSSGNDAIRKHLGSTGTRIDQMHWTSFGEAMQSILAPSAEVDASVMTSVEVLALEDAKLTAVEAAGDKVSSAALRFPMSPAAAAALQAFHTGASDVLILFINGETVDLRPCEHQQLDAASLCAVLPADAPAYLLYRWKHEREGEARAPALFVYCCPEESPVRAKMLHASTKAAALEHVAEAGVQVTKSFEVSSPSEVDAAFLEGEFYPASVEKVAITKARPAGGRRLVKKREG